MNKIGYYTLFSIAVCGFHNIIHAQEQRQYVISGQIIDRDDHVLLLAKPFERFDHQHDTIRVTEGTFEHIVLGEPETVRKLIFGSELARGAFRSVDFFLEGDTIDFLLHPTDRFEENRISGGPLNKELKAFNTATVSTFAPPFDVLYAKRDSLFNDGNYYSEPYWMLLEAINDADTDQRLVLFRQRDSLEQAKLDLTADGNRLREEMIALQQKTIAWRYAYIAENPSPISLYLLLNDLLYEKENKAIVQSVAAVYPDYAGRFPNHPYIANLEQMLRGILGIAIGGRIIDFEAPDLKGDYYQLSQLLTEKVMLIDFWGSWCGPCIAKTRTMVPLYEMYKDKGFGLVGIAREFKNTDALHVRLEAEDFNWVNLVELDDQQSIWKKYGMSNAAGMMLLVDRQGKILAINPTANEVQQLLDQVL